MSSSENKPRAIMSYTRFDDQHNSGRLATFCECLSSEVRAHTGADFPIFQDIKDIQWGEDFAARIEEALNTVQFFIPILTPSFFKSYYCRTELQQFLKRAAELGRNDLILPVYYIRCPELEDPIRRAADDLAAELARHQYVDWRDLRHESFDQPQVKRMLSRMAEQICAALDRMEAELYALQATAFSPRSNLTPKSATPPPKS